jgi:hypothetical protein
MSTNSRKIPAAKRAPKLTRAAVAEGLQSVPIDVVLLGAASAKQTKLTHKQRAFAEGIALGKTKAQAYRDAYDSQGKPETQSRRGQELVADGRIQAQIDALTLANEARKYATPAALRSLVIERLTATAIDEDIKPAQRLRALELLGKVTEVAAFTERREIIKTDSAGDARAALLQNLRAALRANAIDVPTVRIDAQGEDPGAASEAQASEGTVAHPPDAAATGAHTLLSNPHTGSHTSEQTEPTEPTEISVGTYPCQSTETLTPVAGLTLTTLTPVRVLGENPDNSEEGGGDIKNLDDMTDGDIGSTPGGDWK